MNLLLINYEYPPVGGGAATATYEIARALIKLGHRPVVLTARYRERQPDLANPGIKVIEVPAMRRHRDRCSIPEMASFVASATWRIRTILRHERIDAIIAFFSMPCGPIAWWAWRATQVPYVISLRGGDVPGNEPKIALIHRVLRPFRQTIQRQARAVIANSGGLREQAEASDRVTVGVIENGVDTDFFYPPPSPLSATPLKLLFVGRLHAQKNIAWLLEQLAAISPHERHLELHVVGDGPERVQLESRSAQLGLHSMVTWHGWLGRAQLAALYRRCNCLVNPSSYEGMPNVVLEAMASGLPVLLSDHAAHRSLLTDTGAGVLFSREKPRELVDALLAEITNPAVGRHRGEAARRAALRRFSWEQTATRYVSLFQGAED